MELFKKFQEKIPGSKKKASSYENEYSALQNKSKEEIYREKKRQLKFEQAALDNEKHLYEQDNRIEILEEELIQIQQQIQTFREKLKKSRLKLLLFWGFMIVIMIIGFYFLKRYHKESLEEYQQQLETSLNEYSSETETQTQDLQLQMETITQQPDSLE